MAVTWGADTALTTQTAIDNSTEEFLHASGEGIDLDTGLACHIQLEVDNESGSVVDALIVAVYATLDLTSKVFDDEPFMQFSFQPATISLERLSFVVSGIYGFRIGCLSSGATDVYTAGGDYRVRTA